MPKAAKNIIPIEETPQFADAVASAVEKALPALRAQILGNLANARTDVGTGPAAQPGDHAFAESIAMAIASLTDQGTGRKRVAPVIVQQRIVARERMTQLIIEARAAGAVPQYNLRNKVYLDELLVEPVWIAPDHTQRQTVIEWSSVPNEAMIPVNDVAKGIHAAFMDSIGSVEKPAPEAALLGVTAGGLVVRSGSRAMRPLAALGTQEHQTTEGGLNVPHRNRPGQFVEKRILGTVMEPARQTA